MFALCLVALLTVAIDGHAASERFAVVIGSDTGAGDEQRLKYAETDATRVSELLGEVGGVPDENRVLLRGRSADDVRRALIATNERIRVGQRSGSDALLFVYFSGHGDADALHLGDSRLPLRELEALVRGSSSQVRILVVDSCRSGSVTRVKGGQAAAPLALTRMRESPGEGLIVLTASTANEDAQESDALRGSFFTHYFVSGLRGAADRDGDRVVSVSEVFRYTREQTILATSRTLVGTQHPTFHYDFRGRADVMLADLGSSRDRGTLTLPDGATWLVVSGSSTGNVVGEIGVGATRRSLSLRAGRYWVRGRASDALLEGTIDVRANQETRVDDAQLDRSAYARLVRKGRGEILGVVTGPVAGAVYQSSLIEGASPCVGGFAGWSVAGSDLSWSPRFVACRGSFSNQTLDATTEQLGLEMRISKAWDYSAFAFDVGVTAGGELLRERFDTRGHAPDRTTGAGHLDVGAALSLSLSGGLYLTAEGAAQTHFFLHENGDGEEHAVARFAGRGLLGLGFWL